MRLSAILLVVATLSATAAQAQPAPWMPDRLTAGWVFTPSIVIGGLWDSNVTVRASNETVPSEWVGLLNPRGELDFNGRHTHMNVGYSGAFEAYRQFSELNRYEQRGRFELNQQLGPHLDFFSQAGYVAAPTTDRLDLGAGVLPFIDIGSRHADGTAGLRWALSAHTRLTAQYQAQAIHFDSDDTIQRFEYLRSGHSQSPTVSLMHDVTAHLSVGAAWQYSHAIIGGGADVFNVQNTTAELELKTGEHTTVRGGAGVSYLQSPTANLVKWGPAYHAALDHEVGRTILTARYEHAFVPSISFGGMNANETVSGNVHMPFANDRYSISGSVAYGRTEPLDAVFAPDFRLTSLWTQATLGYQATRWLRAEGFVNVTHQTSTARGLVDRTRVGIQFVTSKPVRIQ